MDEEKRKPGRPKGSKKEGKKSPKILFNLLKTKSWAWTCAHFLPGNDETPLTAYALTQEANKKLLSKKPSNQFLHDTIRWSRWLRGLRGVSPTTVRSLWEEPQDAYFVGPWVDHHDEVPGGGAFVPLWAALNGTEGLRKAWEEVPLHAWDGWGPQIVIGEDTPYPDLIVDPDFVPGRGDFRSCARLYLFLTRIAAHKNTPALLALASAITLARIDGIKGILLFDPDPAVPYSLPPPVRLGVYAALAKLNITLPEITCVANHSGLVIQDCSTFTYDEYLKVRWGKSGRASMLRDVTEEHWRDIFGTPR